MTKQKAIIKAEKTIDKFVYKLDEIDKDIDEIIKIFKKGVTNE